MPYISLQFQNYGFETAINMGNYSNMYLRICPSILPAPGRLLHECAFEIALETLKPYRIHLIYHPRDHGRGGHHDPHFIGVETEALAV